MSKPHTPPLVMEMKAEKVRQGLTDADIADRAEMTVQQVRRRWSGDTAMTVTESNRFAAALGLPVSELQHRAESRKSPAAA